MRVPSITKAKLVIVAILIRSGHFWQKAQNTGRRGFEYVFQWSTVIYSNWNWLGLLVFAFLFSTIERQAVVVCSHTGYTQDSPYWPGYKDELIQSHLLCSCLLNSDIFLYSQNTLKKYQQPVKRKAVCTDNMFFCLVWPRIITDTGGDKIFFLFHFFLACIFIN